MNNMLNISGLKCDHCDYRDDTIKRTDYEKYINYACPHCGHSMLTLADYNAVLKIESLMNNPIIKFINSLPFPKNKININFHGNGFKDVDININEVE